MSADAKTIKGPSANEGIKADSRLLRGSIAEDIADGATGGISETNSQLTKFHGLYLQDDRDQRVALKKTGKEKAYGFMLRVRLPGGRATAAAVARIGRALREVFVSSFAAPDDSADVPISWGSQGQC